MQKEIIQKIKGYINIARKAGYLIIGSDYLKNYDKKLYLVIKSDNGGKNLSKIVEDNAKRTNCEVLTLIPDDFDKIVNISNCKVVGIKNKGIADEVIKLCKE